VTANGYGSLSHDLIAWRLSLDGERKDSMSGIVYTPSSSALRAFQRNLAAILTEQTSWYNSLRRPGPSMQYSIDLVNVQREASDLRNTAGVVYAFTISNGVARTRGDVVLPEAGVDIIEKKGKDALTAAKIALERLLKQGRNPFETQILLRVPFGHAEYFSRYGNYGTLPTLTD
jgi:hypothetical protein